MLLFRGNLADRFRIPVGGRIIDWVRTCTVFLDLFIRKTLGLSGVHQRLITVIGIFIRIHHLKVLYRRLQTDRIAIVNFRAAHLTFFRLNNDDTIHSFETVHSGGGIFQDVHRSDLIRIDLGKRTFHSIHNN